MENDGKYGKLLYNSIHGGFFALRWQIIELDQGLSSHGADERLHQETLRSKKEILQSQLHVVWNLWNSSNWAAFVSPKMQKKNGPPSGAKSRDWSVFWPRNIGSPKMGIAPTKIRDFTWNENSSNKARGCHAQIPGQKKRWFLYTNIRS